MSLNYSLLSRQALTDQVNAAATYHESTGQSAAALPLYRPTHAQNGSQSREHSVTRGRNTNGTSQAGAASSRTPSAHPTIPEGEATTTAIAVDTGNLQRRVSNRHHRQTSVINGLQHSRNPSFNSPLTSSPLSPESLHNAGLRSAATRRGPGYAMDMDSSVSAFPLSNHIHGPSIDSTLNLDSSFTGSSGSIRTQSSTTRAAKGHAYGTSFGARPEGRTPSEYAMHHLLNAFFIKADQKIDYCLTKIDILPSPVEQICGPGGDPAFDQLLLALGHVARRRPVTLVDSLMLWRQNKADTLNASRKQLSQHGPPPALGNGPVLLPRRHTEPVHEPSNSQQSSTPPISQSEDLAPDEYTLLEGQTTVSIYILCRGLMEVFQQSTLEEITPDLAQKLEGIVFEQLIGFEPHNSTTSKTRAANWRIYAQLLGQMSVVDFTRVTSRFLTQLRGWQGEITSNTITTARVRDLETRIELLLLGMKHLRINLDMNAYLPACDFLMSLAQLFVESHGPRIKQAYCLALESLLLQIASRPNSMENEPSFKKSVNAINLRINQMLTKMRHWSIALPTSIALLCLTPVDDFQFHLSKQLDMLSNKLRERGTRTPAMRAICQLTWTYIMRSTDTTIVKTRKVEEIVKLVLPAGRKPHVSTEPSIAEAMLCFLRIVGIYFPESCFRLAILPLINPDSILSNRDLRIEQLEPEKVTVGIQAFLLLMEDKEKGLQAWPSFPEFHIPLQSGDAIPTSPMPFSLATTSEQPAPLRRIEFVASTSPVDLARLDSITRGFLLQFCDILGKITVLCDNTFGASAVLNEKFSAATPKTPLVDALSLSKKDDSSLQDQKSLYYDLLDVAIQALARCFSDNMPLSPLVNLLCTCSAHVQPHVARAATRSLKAIASHGYAQPVTTAFPRFIFNYDHQYSTMSDDGRLGSNHIEATLTLYLELLQIWVVQIGKRAKATASRPESITDTSAARALQMEMTSILSLVDEIEGYGLFFLCSQSRKVRTYAIKVLELVLQFDLVLGKEAQARVFTVLETSSDQILDIADEALTLLERSRLQKDKRRKTGQNVTAIELCSSETYYDSTLWFKAFPNMIKIVFEMCPHAIALSREFVCDRLALMQADVERLAVNSSGAQETKLVGRSADTPISVFFDQWKLYLVMACVTLSSTGGQSQSQLANAQHGRKTSRNTSGLQDKMSSARSLFSAVIPMLGASEDALRSVVVTALGAINRKLYRILLESLQYAVIRCNDEAKARRGAHQRNPSSPSRSLMTERMRTEVTCIYKLTATFLRHDEILRDEWILNNLLTYARESRLYLSDSDVQSDWKFSRLRFHYCGMVEIVYENIQRLAEPSRWMSFESRKSAFALMEEWCGYRSEAHGAFWPEAENNHKSAMAKEKITLRTAALSAMSTLCAGPVRVLTEANTILQFNIPRMLSWIDSVFTSRENKLHEIGQRALRNLILHNGDTPVFVEHAIQCCYGTKGFVAQENCFNVIADVLMQRADFPLNTIKVLGAVMFTLGHDSRDIRIKSARLLRFLDEKEQKSSNLQHFDISISDKTRAVYKAAQFEYSRRLASTHPDLAFHIFSEFSLQFRSVGPDIQRNMVAAVLPWLQTLELQVLPDSSTPTDLSHMLLVNMIEITIRAGSALHNEVQALWQALTTGPYGGNVQLILDFIIDLSLDRREQNFVYCAKQIVVYLSATPAGSKIFDHFLLQLAAKNMPNERKPVTQPMPTFPHLPYVANLETVLPIGNRQGNLSLGHISLIFLVDLLVPPVQLQANEALKLLHAVFILWDHHTGAVQEHAREMLVHLIHILVIARMDSSQESLDQLKKTENLVEAVRSNDPSISWSYGDLGIAKQEDNTNRVPAGMAALAEHLLMIFSSTIEQFSDAWAKEALHWASVCPVRHLACRSFQVFRCISVKLDSTLLSDLLARLSNTIADEHADYQTFSLEILTTLKVVIAGLDKKDFSRYPQLIWTTIACLSTIHEREFYETLGMLDEVANGFDFSNPLVVDAILKAQPSEWQGRFDGIVPLIYKGLQSSVCYARTLGVVAKLISQPNSGLLGGSDRLLFDVLAHLPRLLEGRKQPPVSQSFESAAQMACAAQSSGLVALSEALSKPLPTPATPVDILNTWLTDILNALKAAYFPQSEAEALIFMIGLLTNNIAWLRVNVLEILQRMIPLVDMKNGKILGHGADLISPLLRLLQTSLCDQALKVMDLIMEVNTTPLERHHLRMSMASGPAPAIRKEYENIESLYGIPEISGWSVPVPAIRSEQTRNNVHHVFCACTDADGTGEIPSQTPEIDFHSEEDFSDSYFPAQIVTDHYDSYHASTDFSMGDIVSSLDDLDDFFDENETPTTPTGESRNSGLGSFAFFNSGDHETNVYDQQTAPIISRSMNRTASSLNFHQSFADPRPATSTYVRPQQSFSSAASSQPGSFTTVDEVEGPGPSMPTLEQRSPVRSQPTHNILLRPGLHSRSITSPANQYPISQPTPGSMVPPLPLSYDLRSPDMPYAHDEVHSDSGQIPFPTMPPTISHTGTRSVIVTPTSATDATAGFMRRGMRRLTGGKSESAKEKSRLRAPSSGQNTYNAGTTGSGQSPRVPRVPSEYLSNTPTTSNAPAGPNPSPLSPRNEQ